MQHTPNAPPDVDLLALGSVRERELASSAVAAIVWRLPAGRRAGCARAQGDMLEWVRRTEEAMARQGRQRRNRSVRRPGVTALLDAQQCAAPAASCAQARRTPLTQAQVLRSRLTQLSRCVCARAAPGHAFPATGASVLQSARRKALFARLVLTDLLYDASTALFHWPCVCGDRFALQRWA